MQSAAYFVFAMLSNVCRIMLVDFCRDVGVVSAVSLCERVDYQ